MSITDNHDYIKQMIAVFLGLLMAKSAASAESKLLSLMKKPQLASVALLSGALLAGTPEGKALAAPQNPEGDVDKIVEVMEKSGFTTPKTGFGAMAFRPNGDGTYKITARLDKGESTNACKIAMDARGNSADSLVCNIASWQAPDGFEKTLASDKMTFSSFWETVNQNEDFPSYRGVGEMPNPIEASVFPLNSDVNQQLVDTQAGVWETCFSPEGRSKKAVAGHERKECRNAKDGLVLAMGDADVVKTEWKNQKATVENQKATVENQKATKDLETVKDVLKILKGNKG